MKDDFVPEYNTSFDDLNHPRLVHNSQKGGVKDSAGKPEMWLLPPLTLMSVSRAFQAPLESGKYTAHNYLNGIKFSKYYSAALRHIFKKLSGENIDAEFGLDHIDHAIADLMILRESEHRGLGAVWDDRYKANPM